ncbi:MAG TPA: hypothetical protein VLJ76_04220, partial [Gaiellaceae bacterium]|nr:hypothetical protein [Gaiellaceae bacterium]
MATVVVRTPNEFEERLRAYIFERSEEGRAVRVGEKETSDQAAIVARYADLFSRDQLDSLHEAEQAADDPDERERIYRLRKTCEGGLISAQLVEREDALENAELATQVTFRGETMPLRAAQAKLAILTAYADRDELGALAVAWIAPSSSRSAYSWSTASFACAFRSGISSPWNVTRAASS